MNHLLDVNVLVAWGWEDHEDHQRVVRWITTEFKNKKNIFLTSAIPELGFVRVSVQRSQGELAPSQVSEVLQGMLHALAPQHRFLPDDLSAYHWPSWCQSASHTTDAHLYSLAKKHEAILVTLDRGIPDAFLIN